MEIPVLPKKIRATKYFVETTIDQVAGCLSYSGKPKTLAQMELAIKREVIRRHLSGRY